MVQALVDPPLAKMNRYRDRHDGTVIVFVIVISLSLVIVLSLSPCRFRVSLSSFLSHYRYCRIVLSLSLSRHRYRVIVIASSWSHYSSRVIVFWAELPWTGLLIADRRSQLDMARLQKRVFRKKLDLIWSDDLFCWGRFCAWSAQSREGTDKRVRTGPPSPPGPYIHFSLDMLYVPVCQAPKPPLALSLPALNR